MRAVYIVCVGPVAKHPGDLVGGAGEGGRKGVDSLVLAVLGVGLAAYGDGSGASAAYIHTYIQTYVHTYVYTEYLPYRLLHPQCTEYAWARRVNYSVHLLRTGQRQPKW